MCQNYNESILSLSHSLSLFLLQPSFVCSHVSFFYKTISNISKISLYQLFLRLSPLKGRTKPGIQMADIRRYDPLNILNPPDFLRLIARTPYSYPADIRHSDIGFCSQQTRTGFSTRSHTKPTIACRLHRGWNL